MSHNAMVLSQHGLSPLGGVVDGVDQMNEHEDKRNELPGGAKVTISGRKGARVTTYGKHYDGAKVQVVTVEGRRGYYMASGFGPI